MKKVRMSMSGVALFLLIAGLMILCLPYICQILYKHQATTFITAYNERVVALVDDEGNHLDWLYKRMMAYNKELYGKRQNGLVDPFSYQQAPAFLMELDLDDEMIGYLSIPQMNIDLPIYLGANKENMCKGAALLTQTSLPIGGKNTNAVFAAHRGMSTAVMFRDIEKLEIGDEVLITNFWETLTYYVAEIAVIRPTDIGAILIQENRDLVTLITCHPYRHNYQRYVVYCEREKSLRQPASDTD